MYGYFLAQTGRRRGYVEVTAMNQIIDSKELETPQRIDHPSRLMDLNEMGAYLGVSYWTARDLVLTGKVPRVRIPLSFRQVRKRGKAFKVEAEAGLNLRRILVDRRDLDPLIDSWKAT